MAAYAEPKPGAVRLAVDLRRKLKFPDHVTATSPRPEVVLTSAASKLVLEEANEWKRAKYRELVGRCRTVLPVRPGRMLTLDVHILCPHCESAL